MEKPLEVQPTTPAVSGMPSSGDSTTMSRRQVLKYSALLGAGIPALRILQRPASLGMSRTGAAANKVQLRMLQYQTYYQDDNEVWKAYERTQDKVSVTTDFTSYTTYLAALTTRGRTGNLEDLVNMQAGSTFAAANPLLHPYKQADFGSLYNQLSGWSSCLELPNLKTYFGVPFGTVAVVWYFNKAALKKAGVRTTSPPATWAELVKACEGMKAAGITPIANSGSDNNTTWFMWSTLTVQYYPDQLDGPRFALGQLKVTDSGMTNAIGYMEKMYQSGWWTSQSLGYTYSDAVSDFINGKAGIIAGLNVNPIYWGVFDRQMGKDAYLVSRAPLLPNAKTKVPWGVALPNQVVSIAKDTPHYQDAYDALKYLVGPKGQAILLEKVGQFPNRSDVPVLAITGSPGAESIAKILKGKTANAPLGYMSAGAADIGFKDLSEAIVSGKTSSFLRSMEAAQGASLLK
jgi:ABC-type glycerol-3-phosphate transport system substrate-binding protein